MSRRLAAVCSVLLLAPLSSSAIFYDSGDVVNIDTDTGATADVRDGPGPSPTTLNGFPGARFTLVTVRETSIANLLPFSVASSGVNAVVNATVRIYGGTHAGISVDDDADLFVLDARVEIFSGSVVSVNGGKLEIRGGTFQETGSSGPTIAVNGGGELDLCGGVLLPNASGVAVIDAEATAGAVRIEGGTFSKLALANAGIVYGTGLEVRDDMGGLVQAGPGVVSGMLLGATITGTLADGSALSSELDLELGTTTLTLSNPEANSICAVLPPPPAKGPVPIPGWALGCLVVAIAVTPWWVRWRTLGGSARG